MRKRKNHDYLNKEKIQYLILVHDKNYKPEKSKWNILKLIKTSIQKLQIISYMLNTIFSLGTKQKCPI